MLEILVANTPSYYVQLVMTLHHLALSLFLERYHRAVGELYD